MLEPGSLAIQAARAAIGEAQAAAQRVHRLTQGRAEACEGLVAALQRWPSFAVADPWAIEAPLPAGPASPEGQAPAMRVPSWREALRPTAGQPPSGAMSTAIASRPRPGALSPQANNSRLLQALGPASAARGDVEVLRDSAPGAGTSTAMGAAMPQAATLAALVAHAIARHTPQALADSTASSTTWRSLLQGAADNTSTIESAPPPRTSSSGSHLALQSVDLPTRAALDGIARASPSSPSSSALAPAADLLQRLLPEMPPADHAPATPPRAVAPRAPSRLLSAPVTSAATPATTARPAMPGHTLPDEDEASADAISRLLADQAWLRGADFT